MIPIKLTLKNFMSYGAEPVVVPFEGLHVACLSGDNGNGKSALLDAMTWALWDKTRAPSKDDIIRVGADEVEVKFEFELNAQQYRVVKKRRRGKAGGGDWQLTQIDGAGNYAPIGGNSQKDVGEAIVKLLSMEYETFLNSAYLQQGHADEFTRQTPDRRKKILGEILGLERYVRLEEKARVRVKQRKEIVDELDLQIRLLAGEVERLPEYETSLEETRARLDDVTASVEKQEAVTLELREKRTQLDVIAGQMEQAQSRVRALTEDIKGREGELCSQSALVERLQKTIDQTDAITDDYAKLQNALRRRQELEPKIEEFSAANKELSVVQGVIDGAEKELRGEIRLQENKAQTAEARMQERVKVEAQIVKLKADIARSTDVAAQLTAAITEQQALQQELAELSARYKELTASLKELDEVLELLSGPHAACPVCDSDLSGKKHEIVLGRQRDKQARWLAEQKQVKQEGAARKQQVTQAGEQVTALTAQQNEQVARANRLNDLTTRMETYAAAPQELTDARKQVDVLQARLQNGDFAAPQRIKRTQLESKIEVLKLAKVAHEEARQQQERYQSAQKRHLELQAAVDSLPNALAEVARLEGVMAAKSRERLEAETRRSDLEKRLAQYEEIKRQANVADADLARLQSELNSLKVAQASFVKFIEGCAGAAIQKKEREKERGRVEEERRMYTGLVNAFGRKGVQALIIDNAIPELQEEANGLLARITDNALQVEFNTTKTLKTTREEVETLDIVVMDDMGARPYEMFSGGEAFRVNFAIRIGLSRLLARRSGARLETLILDEGFGSQDGKGREKLIEAIDGIKEDFKKILVITHVDELKDAFPQRIEVTKDASGSHVHVM